MDCRKLSVFLLILVVTCKGLEDDVLSGESMVEVVQRLVREVNVLKVDNQKMKVDNEKLKTDDRKLIEETEKLKIEAQKLKVDNEKVKADCQKLRTDNEKLRADDEKLKLDTNKLKIDNKELKDEVSRLKNNGHSQFSVADQQWQSLHMAAAAACRASTALGGHGPNGNMVIARTTGQSCNQVCKNSKVFTECDASVSILGYMGRSKVAGRIVGAFYNYHCSSPGWEGMHHENNVADTDVIGYGGYYGYCCCRRP